MSDSSSACTCVVDCSGLLAIAKLTGNLKATALARLAAGEMAVPSIAWKEFQDLYEDEAGVLEPHITKKVSLGKKYHLGAASIAEGLNSGFPRGAYDQNGDLYTASIAMVEGYQVVTASSQVTAYKTMKCVAVDVASWAAA